MVLMAQGADRHTKDSIVSSNCMFTARDYESKLCVQFWFNNNNDKSNPVALEVRRTKIETHHWSQQVNGKECLRFRLSQAGGADGTRDPIGTPPGSTP